MGYIVGLFLVTYYCRGGDGAQLCGDPEELISPAAVNRHRRRRGGGVLEGGIMQRRTENTYIIV